LIIGGIHGSVHGSVGGGAIDARVGLDTTVGRCRAVRVRGSSAVAVRRAGTVTDLVGIPTETGVPGSVGVRGSACVG
jgi:hypothetical protein